MPSLTQAYLYLSRAHNIRSAPPAQASHESGSFVQGDKEPAVPKTDISPLIAIPVIIGIIIVAILVPVMVIYFKKKVCTGRNEVRGGRPFYQLGSARSEAHQMRSWFGGGPRRDRQEREEEAQRSGTDQNWNPHHSGRGLPGSWSSYWSDNLTVPQGRWVGERFEMNENLPRPCVRPPGNFF